MKARVTNRGIWSRFFAEVVKDRKIIGVIDQSDEGGRIPRNQWGLVRRALALVALKVLDENPRPPPDCTDAGWYQGNVKLIACEDERSAALYKAAINKVGEVYLGAKLAVCGTADIPSRPRARVRPPSEPSEPEAILSLLTRFNPKLPTDSWKVVKVEKTERVTIILLNQACFEPLAAQQYRVNYGFDKVQLRIYDTDKLDTNPRATTNWSMTESLKQLCTQDIARPGRNVLQNIAEGTQPNHGPKDGVVPAD